MTALSSHLPSTLVCVWRRAKEKLRTRDLEIVASNVEAVRGHAPGPMKTHYLIAHPCPSDSA
jgi:hypothetical protein